MKIANLCKNYFSGFQKISNFKNNNCATNTLSILLIVSYFSAVIPLGFAAVYGVDSLCGRVRKKEQHLSPDASTINQAQIILRKQDSPSKVTLGSNLRNIGLMDVLNTYNPRFYPRTNQTNLMEYSHSADCNRHAKTARIYYNSSQLAETDALRIVFQREPTNITMGSNQYDEVELERLFGYRKGIYNDINATKEDGTPFRELPNSVAIYSETFLWDPPGGNSTKEIACLSIPAPALDSTEQPHYHYYMQNEILDAFKYQSEIAFLFKTIEQAVRDNKDTAFGGKGIQRLVLSRFGQVSFLGALTKDQRKIAHDIFKKELNSFLKNIDDLNLDIVMSEYKPPLPIDIWYEPMIIGDIVETAKEGDLIINAWDPHSAPGNGNDGDHSFDGAMGRGSGILLTQTAWLNPALRCHKSLQPISAPTPIVK